MRRSSLNLSVLLVGTILSANAQANFPECLPPTPTPEALTAWRDGAINAVKTNNSTVANAIKSCFGNEVPKCLERTYAYAERNNIASYSDEPSPANTPQKLPPKELLAPNAQGLEYIIPTNIEEIAQSKGWIYARYKSRHAGGFDSSTPSLMMVYVPGELADPAVTFDRWLNFALPADKGDDALNPLPQAKWPTLADYAAESSNNGPSLPRTFTMVSLEHPTDTEPARVFFQKFRREGYGSPIYTPESNSSVTGCYSCHPNGLRAISPLGYHVRAGEKQLPEEVWHNVTAINDAMDDIALNRVVSWGSATDANGQTKPLLRPEGHFPIIGQSKPQNGFTRTQAFIMGGTLPDGSVTPGCYKQRPQVSVRDIFSRDPGKDNVYTLSADAVSNIDWKKVAGSMKCQNCHNNRSRGALNDEHGFSQIDFKILVDQSMPLGAHRNPLDQGSPDAPVVDTLTPDERIALANCLQAEKEVEAKYLNEWLAAAACQ